MSFFLNQRNLYGLPERENGLRLNFEDSPFELMANPVNQHSYLDKEALYGVIPYLLGVENDIVASIAWVNSAKGYVDLKP